jgi:putative heme-binding domain-containing protein
MKPALELTGDPLKGKSVFKNLCSACHIYGNSGNEVGPVLTEISRKSKEALAHEILDPNASVDTRYLNYKIVTTDGSIYFGLVSSEKDTELVLKMAGGEEIIIPKNTIEVFMSTGKSLMPEGLEAGINKQQLADLLAFLQQEQ